MSLSDEIGAYYDRKREEAERVALQLEAARAELAAGYTPARYRRVQRLIRALDFARYVGD